MAENIPSTPGGSVPPKPPEPAKVQPKKETVRISLPPKPASSPTIKLPSVPGGAPAGAAPASAAPAAAPGSSPRPATSAPSASGAPGTRPPTSTGPAATRPPSPTPAPRPSAPIVKKISGLDMGLAIAAAVIGLGAIASVLLLLNLK